MTCDKCRWFNKNGFALGFGDCVLRRCVCGSSHNVCEHYEEYESRPHGEWEGNTEKRNLITRKCTACGGRSAVGNFCMWCGADMREEGDTK